MRTPEEYLNKNKQIIPCDGKKPIKDGWQKKTFNLEDFKPENNIGLKLNEDSDIDIETNLCLPFVEKYISPCSAVFGRGEKPRSHFLFKGVSKAKKFILHDDLKGYFNDLPHGACLIECRHGSGYQTIVPGSKINGTSVEWDVFEGISPYPGDLFKDVSKVALATALRIVYPASGKRDDFCYSVACILAKHTKWRDHEIDEFITDIAKAVNDPDWQDRRGKGTHAYKQITNGGKLRGFNSIREILGLTDATSIYKLFEWVGVHPPDKNLEELKKNYVFVQDSSSMFNVKDKTESKKEDFNNRHLYHFPGGKDKKKAFESLMTDYEFFYDKVVRGRAVLPGYDYPIAEIGKDHFYLEPGRYLNLYPGPPIEPDKGDVSDWVNSFKLILGEENYEYIEQYYGAVIQKIFKHKLDLTKKELEEIGPMKIQWGHLIVGPEGTGKKALAETLQRIIGREFVDANARYDELIGNHSEVIYNKLFIFINEVVTTGEIEKKVEISNKLKPFWTDEDSKINPKHIRPFRYWNNCNGMCLSNEENCLHLGKSSRRYAVINLYDRLNPAKLIQFEKDGVFKKIYKFIQSDKIKHLFHYFLYEVKIKDWPLYNQGRAPVTNALIRMQEEAQHPTIQRLDRCLDEQRGPFDKHFPGFISLDDLIDYVRSHWKIQINEKYLKDWLRGKAFKWKNGKQTRQIMKPDGSRPRVWLLKDDDFLRDMGETKLGSIHFKSKYEYQTDQFEWQLRAYETNPGKINSAPQLYTHVIKRTIGSQWDENEEFKFHETLFNIQVDKSIKLISLRNKCKIPKSGGAGGDDEIDWKLFRERKQQLEKATEEEKKKLIKKWTKPNQPIPYDIFDDGDVY